MLLTPQRTMNLASKQSPSRFLRIPSELREEIYRELFNSHPSSLSSLLAVHPLISHEVGPWIFKLPQTFNGQQRLLDWLSKIDPVLLSNVSEVRFRLHDLSPEKIVDSFRERLRRQRSVTHAQKHVGHPYNEACDEEVLAIKTALQSFQNLESFTLLETTSADARPPASMVKGLVALLLKELPLVSFNIPHRLLHQVVNTEEVRSRSPHIEDRQPVVCPDLPKAQLPYLPKLSFRGRCHDTGVVRGGFAVHGQGQWAITRWESLPALQDLACSLRDTVPMYYDYEKGHYQDILAL
ncbi:MAG: hypothetical protein Q9212_005171 [Teloschistes hypoglaucus]